MNIIVIRIDHCSPIVLLINSPTVALHDRASSKVGERFKSFGQVELIDGAGLVFVNFAVHELCLRRDRLSERHCLARIFGVWGNEIDLRRVYA